MPTKNKSLISAEDLYQFELITDARLSPDGRHVIYTIQRTDRKTEKKHNNLWLADTGSGQLRQFTYGDWSDSAPRWSPDGRTIAFLSNRADENQNQITLIPLDGGEAHPLTNFKDMAVAGFEWSPDGKQFLCTLRQKDQEAVEREADKQKKKLGIVARHITSTRFKGDGQGYLPQEKWHQWVVNARSGKATQITHGRNHEDDATWSPDGQWIAYITNNSPQPDLTPEMDDLFIIPAKGGEARQLATPAGHKFALSWSPDGRWLAYIGSDKPGEWWRNETIWLVAADNSTPPRALTAHTDLHIMGNSGSDTGGGQLNRPTWAADSQRLYFQAEHKADICLMSATLDAEPLVERIIAAPGLVGLFTLDTAQQKLAYTHATQQHPAQLRVRDLATGKEKQLTRNNGWLNRKTQGQIEEVWFNARDGYPLHGWIMTPPNFDPRKKYPSILEIHGGPQTQYDRGFMHEFHTLAANGYVVYWSNPRGGQGYGEAHCGAIWNNWGTVDLTDVLDWVAEVGQRPYIDPQRKGVTGGSYGGYMTALLIGREPDLFQAAVAQRSVTNLISMWGSSDGNWEFQQALGDNKPPYENLQKYWDHSPLKTIGAAKTPTLVIHSEQDLRAAPEQGEQLFVALRHKGVETELILFPEEPHGLSRNGRTDRRVARLQHILRWFDTYLK